MDSVQRAGARKFSGRDYFSESKGVINGYYFGWNGEDKKWYAACGEYEGLEEGVTHWTPLPAPPEKAP